MLKAYDLNYPVNEINLKYEIRTWNCDDVKVALDDVLKMMVDRSETMRLSEYVYVLDELLQYEDIYQVGKMDLKSEHVELKIYLIMNIRKCDVEKVLCAEVCSSYLIINCVSQKVKIINQCWKDLIELKILRCEVGELLVGVNEKCVAVANPAVVELRRACAFFEGEGRSSAKHQVVQEINFK